jgi:hypothetical protein
MQMSKVPKALVCHIPDESVAADRILGPPSLLLSENPAMYAELLARVRAAVNPRNIIEEILIRDMVDHSWEILRWRRVKVDLHAKLERCNDDRFANAEFRQISSNIERVDRLITIAEHRRNAGWHEVDHCRSIFAERLRNTIGRVMPENGDGHLRQIGDREMADQSKAKFITGGVPSQKAPQQRPRRPITRNKPVNDAREVLDAEEHADGKA